ncbi:GNAT family N-acetyltransferase, partial [Aquimarina litoralis]|uniref:GNAT family N-acetyltransferase n=1 Tax=Aquimarina litoralis TaxID=584605 RepID=UPI001C57E84E
MKTLHFVTDRLELKVVEGSDLENVHQLLTIPEVDQYNALGIPTNKEVTQVYLDEWIDNYELRKEFVFAIRLKVSNDFVGLISLIIGNSKYKIGTLWYKLDPKFWGNGYATEAVKEVLKFSFQKIELHRVEAGCAIANIGSVKVLEKSGMKREGHKREILPLKT